jgi:CO/xanthine dehydrogenase FAD-binding subunit
MKPPVFEYRRVSTVDEALTVLAQEGADAKVLAGGQSLIPLLNLRLARPHLLLDINPIGELGEVTVADGALRLGALVRHRTLETSPEIAARAPLLKLAAQQVGHVAIRTRGTIGGSLVHADPAAELGMAALALKAQLHLASSAGTRSVPAESFFLGYYMTDVQPEELLVAVEVPLSANERTGEAVEEFSLRHGDFALAAVAIRLSLAASGRVAEASCAVAGLGPAPLPAPHLADALTGRTAGELADVGEAVLADIEPEDDLHATAAYRRDLARVLATRAARRAYEAASEGA